MKKINVLLTGGVGNQLFIYAALKTFIRIDKSFVPFFYNFATLNIHKNQYFSLDKIVKKKINRNFFLPGILEKIYIFFNFYFLMKILDDTCNEKKIFKLLKYKSLTMFGYFQKTYWYINSYKEIIKEIVKFFLFKYLKHVNNYNIVLSTNYYPILKKLGIRLTFNYYLNGLRKLKIKKTNKILIIGDDKNSCINKLKIFLKKKGYKNCFTYSSLNNIKLNLTNTYEKSIFDYLVIAKSKKLIMSNSTFCWWAAVTREYFNLNSSKVVSPKRYTDNKSNNFDNPGNPSLDWIYMSNKFF